METNGSWCVGKLLGLLLKFYPNHKQNKKLFENIDIKHKSGFRNNYSFKYEREISKIRYIIFRSKKFSKSKRPTPDKITIIQILIQIQPNYTGCS